MGAVAAPRKQLLLNALDSNSQFKHSLFQLSDLTEGLRIGPSFSGFLENSDNIQINTDTRSRKIEELKKCPFAEICWYFTESWEQFWISGRIDVIDGSNPDSVKLQQREKAWFSTSVKSRLQYLGPNPGLPCISEQPTEDLSIDSSTGPVNAFSLLVLDPDQVDYLNLKSNQRVEFASRLDATGVKCWTSERINPLPLLFVS